MTIEEMKSYDKLIEEGEALFKSANLPLDIRKEWEKRNDEGTLAHCPWRCMEEMEDFLDMTFKMCGVKRPQKGYDANYIKDMEQQVKLMKKKVEKVEKLLEEKDSHINVLTDIIGMLRDKERGVPEEIEIKL